MKILNSTFGRTGGVVICSSYLQGFGDKKICLVSTCHGSSRLGNKKLTE